MEPTSPMHCSRDRFGKIEPKQQRRAIIVA
jgi:hypothetical protein